MEKEICRSQFIVFSCVPRFLKKREIVTKEHPQVERLFPVLLHISFMYLQYSKNDYVTLLMVVSVSGGE
jgi:hypothetical protein